MFRFQDNVPEVYINESRDFLLLARLSDVLFSGVKYDIDSMVNVLDAALAKDRMLLLMCTKVGFFPNIEIDSQVLKYIIASFPYIIKNKGNEVGIKYAVNAILKAENNPDAVGKPLIKIINNNANSYEDPYTVYIYTTIKLYNEAALREVLRYVLPAGYVCKFLQYGTVLDSYKSPDIISQSDKITTLAVNQNYGAQIRTSFDDPSSDIITDDSYIENLADTLVNAYDMMEISTSVSAEISETASDNLKVNLALTITSKSATDLENKEDT